MIVLKVSGGLMDLRRVPKGKSIFNGRRCRIIRYGNIRKNMWRRNKIREFIRWHSSITNVKRRRKFSRNMRRWK